MATNKKAVKKPVAKKPAAKKAAPAKKPVAKKPAPAKKAVAKKPAPAKKPVAKKPAPAKKPVAKKPVPVKKPVPAKKPAPAKKPQAQKAPTQRKSVVITKPAPAPAKEIDTAKAVAFAMSIAQEMKKSARKQEHDRIEAEIRLSRRPTTRSQGKSTVKFPAADLKEFRKRLIESRKVATSGVNAMKATGFNETDDREADGGDGTSQTLRLQALGQMGNINRTIQQIDEALHRIDDGSYGVCTVCGQLIRKPRLLNQPFVLTCMECQNEMERSRS